jgi:hypothetical protein
MNQLWITEREAYSDGAIMAVLRGRFCGEEAKLPPEFPTFLADQLIGCLVLRKLTEVALGGWKLDTRASYDIQYPAQGCRRLGRVSR